MTCNGVVFTGGVLAHAYDCPIHGPAEVPRLHEYVEALREQKRLIVEAHNEYVTKLIDERSKAEDERDQAKAELARVIAKVCELVGTLVPETRMTKTPRP